MSGMPPSERALAGGAAEVCERREDARRDEGKERVAGVEFLAPWWRKRRGSWEVVERDG
jgi:hypothetical protein